MNDLQTRSIWGFLFVVILSAAIYWGPETFALVFLILSGLTLKEFYDLSCKAEVKPQYTTGILSGIVIFCTSFAVAKGVLAARWFTIFFPILFIIMVKEMYRKEKLPFRNIAMTVLGLVYVIVPFALMNFIVYPSNGIHSGYTPHYLLCLFIFVWMGDSGAYLFGVNFGKHRLFERISPKKSWEGFIGGIATAIFGAWLITLIWDQFSFVEMGTIAAVTVICGTLGDLVESMLKRDLCVKDSGRFMPGHGGLLDRFDSIIGAIPVIYFILQIFH